MRHKYLREIKNPSVEHPRDWANKYASRKSQEGWFKERQKYGFDSRETWDLDYAFYCWLYERLRMFKDKAMDVVDLNYHKFQYKGEEITLTECIDRMIEGSKLYLQDADTEDVEKQEKINSVIELLGMTIRYLWW